MTMGKRFGFAARGVTMVLWLLAGGTASSAEEPFRFRGVTLGSAPTEDMRMERQQAAGRIKSYKRPDEELSLEGFELKSIWYRFLDDKLYEIYVTALGDAYDVYKARFVGEMAKFGEVRERDCSKSNPAFEERATAFSVDGYGMEIFLRSTFVKGQQATTGLFLQEAKSKQAAVEACLPPAPVPPAQ